MIQEVFLHGDRFLHDDGIFGAPDGTQATSLDRLPLRHDKDEAWLQGILDLHPSLLPVPQPTRQVQKSLGMHTGW